VALVNQELVGGPDAAFETTEEAKAAAEAYLVEKLRDGLTEFAAAKKANHL
jgi:hypothetical protein